MHGLCRKPKVPDEAAEKISTVGDAIKYIKDNVKAE